VRIPEFSNLPEGTFKETYERIKEAHKLGRHKELFNLQENYSEKDVEHSFRRLCLKIHPDKNLGFSNESTALIIFVSLIKDDLIQKIN